MRKRPIEDFFCKCPHCDEVVSANVEVDWSYPAYGTADLKIDEGYLYIDWESSDIDVAFIYKCPECGESLADSLDDLEEQIRKYESKKKGN